jgi:hypothetical protein
MKLNFRYFFSLKNFVVIKKVIGGKETVYFDKFFLRFFYDYFGFDFDFVIDFIEIKNPDFNSVD